MAWVTCLGVCMYISAVYSDCITECFHGSGISGALCFSIYQCTPGGVCIIILPAFISVAAVAAEIIICSQYPVIALTFLYGCNLI